jgi:uncharacterized protein (TIGR00296 family)
VCTPLFVTWNIRSGHSRSKADAYDLRGCIGTFSDIPIASGLSDYALIAALQDSRFQPIRAPELPKLQCAVSLLTSFEECESMYDWKIGTHGLRIAFVAGAQRYGATYLPEVCPEQGWTQEECLQSLVRKAGYSKRVRGTEDLEELGLMVTRYQSSKAYLPYDEYKGVN